MGIILLESDFSILFVIELSSVNQPAPYKLCTIWSNNEGSLILWFVLQIIIYFIFINALINKLILLLKIHFFNTIYFGLFILSFFSLLLLLLFINFNFFLDFNALEGKELNFILQDINIVIHPPFIYISYVFYSVIFVVCLVVFISKCKFYIIYIVRFLNLLGWFILSFSILLGSRWAYTELGWGGFWYWDPVEIISFIPWLLTLAFIHNLLMNFKLRIIHLNTLFLGINIYLFIVLGTVLVRSGLLQSVHSFVISSSSFVSFFAFLTLLIFNVLLILFSKYMCLYFTNNRSFNNYPNYTYYMFLLLVSYFFYLLLILFLPILINNNLSFSFDFFNKTLLLFLGPFIILFIIFLLNSKKLIFSFFGIITFFIFYKQLFSYEFFFSYHFFINILIVSLILIIQRKFYFIIYHIGFFFIVLSLLLINIYTEELILNFNLGDSLLFNNNVIIFRDLNQLWSINYFCTYANFLIIDCYDLLDLNSSCNILFSEKRFYLYQSLLNSKSVIYSNILNDFYVLLGDGNFKDGWYLRILFIPFISWFWFNNLLLLLGGFIALYRLMQNIK
uniref:Cytochrome C-type biogenesis protein CCMF n=1 Tax=Cyanidiococcus yangmingshanensis TaxID=2690220 RepID=A0A7G5VUC0_9RHOD|nr:cytochrome C-type biogenesis protein CCMF [Cyanidiococcus yangmingshanensis]QMX77287.1 cytochrome C-type biogenesis protein CCMF [Cyanidiococcus yangmingshanensis]